MDHNEAVAQKATEKYLLMELAPEVRDQFEEHLFDCQDCALDVRAAAMFMDGAKAEFSQQDKAVPVPAPVPVRPTPWWAGWLRPAYAVPAFALLLVVGYQNFVTLPYLKQAANSPRVFAAASINLKTYGSSPSPLMIRSGEGFILNVIVPPDAHYSSYRADLHNPAGGVELSLAIPASTDDTWPIVIPGTNRGSGTYNLTVHGVTADGKDNEVGRGSFELQIQK